MIGLIYCQSAVGSEVKPLFGKLNQMIDRTYSLAEGIIERGIRDRLANIMDGVSVDNVAGGLISDQLDGLVSTWRNLLNLDWITCDMFGMLNLDGLGDVQDHLLGGLLEASRFDDMVGALHVDELFEMMGLGDVFDNIGVADILNQLGLGDMLDRLGVDDILRELGLMSDVEGGRTEMDLILRELLREKYAICQLDKLVDRITSDLETCGESPVIDISNISKGEVTVLLADGTAAAAVLEVTIGGAGGMIVRHIVTGEEAARGMVNVHICPTDGVVSIQAELEGVMSAPVQGVIGGYCEHSTSPPGTPTNTPPTTQSTAPNTSTPSKGLVLSKWYGRVGEVKVELPQDVEAGDVLTVRGTDGKGEVNVDIKHTVTPEEGASGVISISVPPTDDPLELVAEVNGKVSGPITVQVLPKPVVNTANASQGTINVDLPIGTVPGDYIDVVIRNDDGNLTSIPRTASVGEVSDGTVTIPVSIPKGRNEIVAVVGGNSSDPVVVYGGDEGSDEGVLNVPAMDDGVITDEENTDGLPATLTLSNSANVGDVLDIVITNPDGSTASKIYTLTANDVNGGVAELLLGPLSQLGVHEVAISSRGQAVGIPVTLNHVSDEGLPVRIPDNDDGVIDPSENYGGLEVYEKLPPDAEVGEIVTVGVRHPSGEFQEIPKEVTQADLDAGEVMVVVPELPEIGEYGVAAKVGANGEYGPEEVIRVDELMRLESTITSEDIVDSYLTSSRYYKHDQPEMRKTIVTDVTIPNVVAVGDMVEVVVERDDDGSGGDVVRSVSITANMIRTGSVEVVMPEIGADGAYNMQATFTRDGTTVTQSNELMFELDTTVPGDADGEGVATTGPNITIVAADDEKLNQEEIDAGVEVVVTLPVGTEVGDTVTVEVRDANGDVVVEKTGTAGNSEEMTVVLDNMGDLEDGVYMFSASVSDAAGNQSLQSATLEAEIVRGILGSHSLKIDAIDDGYINLPEVRAGVAVDVALVDVASGTTLVVEISDKDGTVIPIEHVITQQEAEAGSALLYITELGVAGDHSIISYLHDSARNEGEIVGPATFVYDDKVPGDTDGDGISDTLPIITIVEADDHKVTAAENADGLVVHVDIPEEYKKTLEIGDEVILSLEGPSGEPVPMSHTITQAELDQGYYEHTIDPLTEDGHYSISGVIRDESGGSTDSVTVSFDLDTGVPGDTDEDGVSDTSPDIVLDDLKDGYINGQANFGHVNATVMVPAGTQEGDTIVVRWSEVGSDVVEFERIVVVGLDSYAIEVDLPSFTGQGAHEIWAQVEDEAGNMSLESSRTAFTIDTVSPGDTTEDGISDTVVHAVMDNTEDDGVLTPDEYAQSTNITVTIPVNTQEGDTLIVTVTDPSSNKTPFTYIVQQSDIDTGTVGVDASSVLTEDGGYLVSALIEDDAGNASLVGTEIGFKYHTNDLLINTIIYADNSEDTVGDPVDAYGEGEVTFEGDIEKELLSGQQVLIREGVGSWMTATNVFQEGGTWKFVYDDQNTRTAGETVRYEYTIGGADGLPIDEDEVRKLDVTYTGTTTQNVPPTFAAEIVNTSVCSSYTHEPNAGGKVNVSLRSPIDESTLHLQYNGTLNQLEVIRTDAAHEITSSSPINVGFEGLYDEFLGTDMVFFPDGSYAVCMYAADRKAGDSNYVGTWSYVTYMSKDDVRQWSSAITYGPMRVMNCKLAALSDENRIGVVVTDFYSATTQNVDYYHLDMQGNVTLGKTLLTNAEFLYLPNVVPITDNRFALAYKLNDTANLKVDILNSTTGISISNVLNEPIAVGNGDAVFQIVADQVDDNLRAESFHVVFMSPDGPKIQYMHCFVNAAVECTPPATVVTGTGNIDRPRIVNYNGNWMINYHQFGLSFGVAYIGNNGVISHYISDQDAAENSYIASLSSSVLSNGKVVLTGVRRKEDDSSITMDCNFIYTIDEESWCQYHMRDGTIDFIDVEDQNGDEVTFTVTSEDGKFTYEPPATTVTLDAFQGPKDYVITASDGKGGEGVLQTKWPACFMGNAGDAP